MYKQRIDFQTFVKSKNSLKRTKYNSNINKYIFYRHQVHICPVS